MLKSGRKVEYHHQRSSCVLLWLQVDKLIQTMSAGLGTTCTTGTMPRPTRYVPHRFAACGTRHILVNERGKLGLGLHTQCIVSYQLLTAQGDPLNPLMNADDPYRVSTA